MCNRYASDIRKAGLEREFYGFDEWSETRITPVLGNAVLEVFPKSYGPVIRKSASSAPECAKMRWGLPGPPSTGGAPVTNIRNIASPHWRSVLGPAHRCLVPFTAFSEYEDSSRPRAPRSFVWRSWHGDYGSKKEPNVGDHLLFSFLTTEANELLRPVHAKAMPVILRTREQCDAWLAAPADQVAGIQSRSLPAGALEIVADDEAAQYVGGYIK